MAGDRLGRTFGKNSPDLIDVNIPRRRRQAVKLVLAALAESRVGLVGG